MYVAIHKLPSGEPPQLRTVLLPVNTLKDAEIHAETVGLSAPGTEVMILSLEQVAALFEMLEGYIKRRIFLRGDF